MGKLIDADTVIEYLGLDSENAREENLGEIVTLEDFDRQPTVFDKERVIEDLNNWREEAEKLASLYDEVKDTDNMEI